MKITAEQLEPNAEICNLLANQLVLKQEILNKARNSLDNALPGRLRISEVRKTAQYYHCQNDKNDKYYNGTYLSRKKNDQLIKRLAQKDYNKDVVHQLEQECKLMEEFIEKYQENDLYHMTENIRPARRTQIMPYTLTNEEYRKYWEEFLYPEEKCRKIVSDIYTVKGEYVRSKSEKIIADELQRRGIPYRYEYPTYVNSRQTFHPDFTVLNVRTRKTYFWEHCGMMTDDFYVEKLSDRLVAYENADIFPGEDIIMTFENEHRPLATKNISLLIDHYLT